MLLLLNEIVVSLDYRAADLVQAAARRLHLSPAKVHLEKILRRALDTRPLRPRPSYVLNAVFTVDQEINIARLPKTAPYSAQEEIVPPARRDTDNSEPRPVVVGCGPAGLAAAYYLARAGRRPIVIERGGEFSARRRAAGKFWGQGVLNPESNVLFGEGGAGAFSDGKLTSRGKDTAGRNFVLRMLVEAGAPEGILIEPQAHLGSDALAHIVPALRARICDLGGEFHFDTRLENLQISAGRLCAIIVSHATPAGRETREIPCTTCVLATGHSADDIYQMLADSGAVLTGKGFALGVRVELPQALVNAAQWGHFPTRWQRHPALGAASFFLTRQGRCHTFCMCPGGRVIACAATPGSLVTNGMSLSPRSGKFANAAFLVPLAAENPRGIIRPAETLAQISHWEQQAFIAGGGDYSLPATTLADFPRRAAELPERSCRRSRSADFSQMLPENVLVTLKDSIPEMLTHLGNPDPRQVVVYGAETRSTAVLRVARAENGECLNIGGLYPAGEGAGYAGGIVSSAVDGLRQAEKALRHP